MNNLESIQAILEVREKLLKAKEAIEETEKRLHLIYLELKQQELRDRLDTKPE